jgi:pimeloyl-ACP methyl ester carboxylesterase
MIGHNTFAHKGLTFTLEPLTEAQGPIRLVWLHGWRSDKEALRPLAQGLLPLGESWLLEMPGHGEAPYPATEAPETLGPAAHAEALCAWLATLPPCPTFILGHSMGFRIALHAAALQKTTVRGIVAIAGAGVPKPLVGKAKLRAQWIKLLLHLGHKLRPLMGERVIDAVRTRYESTDARNCPARLKPMFRAMVRDDASMLLPLIEQPTLLLYGAEDTDTPPALGKRLDKGIAQAQYVELPGLNHYTILSQGRHVVAERIYGFIKYQAA